MKISVAFSLYPRTQNIRTYLNGGFHGNSCGNDGLLLEHMCSYGCVVKTTKTVSRTNQNNNVLSFSNC